jgi:hypothetical protein
MVARFRLEVEPAEQGAGPARPGRGGAPRLPAMDDTPMLAAA